MYVENFCIIYLAKNETIFQYFSWKFVWAKRNNKNSKNVQLKVLVCGASSYSLRALHVDLFFKKKNKEKQNSIAGHKLWVELLRSFGKENAHAINYLFLAICSVEAAFIWLDWFSSRLVH